MKRFRFRLSTVLRVKEVKEKEQLMSCHRLEGKMQDMRTEHAQLECELKEARQAMALQQHGAMNINKVRTLLSYMELLEKSVAQKKEDISSLEKNLREAKAVLLERMKERRAMEHMKERLFTQYRAEVINEWQKCLDDFPHSSPGKSRYEVEPRG